MASGVLYGIGIGPGDPELITLKGLRLLRAAPVVAAFAKAGRTGHAWTIVEPHLRDEQVRIRMDYPFTTEIPVTDPRYHQQMRAFYDSCAEHLAEQLSRGLDVAVICEGDPFFYGSYIYMHERLATRFDTSVDALGDLSDFEMREQLHARVLYAIMDPQLEQALESWLDLIDPAIPAPLRSFRRIAREPASVPSGGRVTLILT